MELEPKQVSCECGNTFTTQRSKSWCEKCCRPVFYHSKDSKMHKINTIYVITMIGGVMIFLTYLFIEMIATPILSFL